MERRKEYCFLIQIYKKSGLKFHKKIIEFTYLEQSYFHKSIFFKCIAFKNAIMRSFEYTLNITDFIYNILYNMCFLI